MCPHQVVYAVKFILRAEGARDYGDLLLSLQHLTVIDFAHQLAQHQNIQSPNFFQPHSGRVCEVTDDSVQSALDNTLEPVDFPWIEQADLPLDLSDLPSDTSGHPAHPVSGSSVRLCLFDTFHEGNTKKQEEHLRRTRFVKQLHGKFNSQAQEQFFSQQTRKNTFLNQMGMAKHVFLSRECLMTITSSGTTTT